MRFTSSRNFRREYERLFRIDPTAANVFLLLTEIADEHGKIRFNMPDPAMEIARLMAIRFEDPRAYQLPGGPKR